VPFNIFDVYKLLLNRCEPVSTAATMGSESYESYGYGHFIDGTSIVVVFIDSTSIIIVYETFPAPPTFLYRWGLLWDLSCLWWSLKQFQIFLMLLSHLSIFDVVHTCQVDKIHVYGLSNECLHPGSGLRYFPRIYAGISWPTKFLFWRYPKMEKKKA
jgi:hypothetical protein